MLGRDPERFACVKVRAEKTKTWCSSRPVIVVLAVAGSILACSRDFPDADIRGHVTPVGGDQTIAHQDHPPQVSQVPAKDVLLPTVPVYGTPTPDPTRTVDVQAGRQIHVVQAGDNLVTISRAHRVSLDELAGANGLHESDLLRLGQELAIPNAFLPFGPRNKLIPDSELVYGPSAVGFDLEGSIGRFGGYLTSFTETDTSGVYRSGTEIITFVAQRYSVNPRLLLTILEYQSGWVRNPSIDNSTESYPLGYVDRGLEGLLKQLSWAADILNAGFYAWRNESLSVLDFPDGSSFAIAPGLNAGTVAVQYLFSKLYGSDEWSKVVESGGFEKTLASMFGSPFAYAYDPLIPDGLVSISLHWPWDSSERWYYTGGPHGGWDSGSAWAAVDFAPPVGHQICDVSPLWVLAAASGLVVRSGEGAVVQDLDGDGIEQTGWDILYMHIDANDRVQVGQYLSPGDRVGHPSCEGGYSDARHLHLARRYNGVWISVDDPVLPLSIDGWKFTSAGLEYDGWMEKGDIRLEAWNSQGDINAIIARDD